MQLLYVKKVKRGKFFGGVIGYLFIIILQIFVTYKNKDLYINKIHRSWWRRRESNSGPNK